MNSLSLSSISSLYLSLSILLSVVCYNPWTDKMCLLYQGCVQWSVWTDESWNDTVNTLPLIWKKEKKHTHKYTHAYITFIYIHRHTRQSKLWEIWSYANTGQNRDNRANTYTYAQYTLTPGRREHSETMWHG